MLLSASTRARRLTDFFISVTAVDVGLTAHVNFPDPEVHRLREIQVPLQPVAQVVGDEVEVARV